MLNLQQGAALIKLAREAISSYFSRKEPRASKEVKKAFSDKNGVFVTLNKDGQLRGCIGFTEAVFPLYEAVIKAAISAAFSDPRFPPLGQDELNNVAIEVSVLTRPIAINVRNPEDYLKHIEVGKDGLMVRGVFNSGLLLPQVAIEYKWDSLTFLKQTCVKAGLQPDSWQDFDACRVYKFQSQVFAETKPNGEVVQKI